MAGARAGYHAAMLGVDAQVRGVVKEWIERMGLQDNVPIGGPSEALLVETMSKCAYRILWQARQLEIESGSAFVARMLDELQTIDALRRKAQDPESDDMSSDEESAAGVVEPGASKMQPMDAENL